MSLWTPHARGPSSRGTYPGAVPGAQPHQGAQGCQHQVSLGRVKQPRQQPHTITLEDFFCSSLLSCQHNQVLSRLGEERHVWVTHPPEQTPCTQGTSCGSPWGSHRHPAPLPVSKERFCWQEAWAPRTAQRSSADLGMTPPLLAQHPSHVAPRSLEFRPSASCRHLFLQDPARSGTSAPPLSPCRTWSSSETDQKEQLSPCSPCTHHTRRDAQQQPPHSILPLTFSCMLLPRARKASWKALFLGSRLMHLCRSLIAWSKRPSFCSAWLRRNSAFVSRPSASMAAGERRSDRKAPGVPRAALAGGTQRPVPAGYPWQYL